MPPSAVLSSRIPSNPNVLIALALAGLLELLLILPVLNAWFFVDDTAVLLCAQYPLLDLLFDQKTGAFCGPLFFTPLWPISFKPETLLSVGLDPATYRLGNLLVAATASGLLFALLRRHTAAAPALAGAALLAVSMPVMFGIGWVTRRHYLLGLLLGLGAIWLFMRYRNSGRRGWLLGSAGAYLLAVLCKEAYAFLPAAIFLLDRGGLRQRLIAMAPFAAALLTYLGWRRLMLGGMGGYPATNTEPLALLHHLGEQAASAMPALLGPAWPLLIVPALILLRWRLLTLLVLTAIAALAMLPLVLYPGSGFEYSNKLFTVMAALAAAVALALDALRDRSRWLVRLMLLATIGLTLGAGERSVAALGKVADMGKAFEETTQAAFAPGAERVLVLDEVPYFYSALNLLHARLGTGQARDLMGVFGDMALPHYADRGIERVVYGQGKRIEGKEAAASFLAERIGQLRARPRIDPPRMTAEASWRSILFTAEPWGEGRLIRCQIRRDFANCATVQSTYSLPYPSLFKVDRLDFYLERGQAISEPVSFRPEEIRAAN